MFKFYYEYLKSKYENRCSLLFTDTDSLCCQIYTHDLYEDMDEDLDLFDTSNFETDHPLYSTVNHMRLGKLKSECRHECRHETQDLLLRCQSRSVREVLFLSEWWGDTHFCRSQISERTRSRKYFGCFLLPSRPSIL